MLTRHREDERGLRLLAGHRPQALEAPGVGTHVVIEHPGVPVAGLEEDGERLVVAAGRSGVDVRPHQPADRGDDIQLLGGHRGAAGVVHHEDGFGWRGLGGDGPQATVEDSGTLWVRITAMIRRPAPSASLPISPIRASACGPLRTTRSVAAPDHQARQ